MDIRERAKRLENLMYELLFNFLQSGVSALEDDIPCFVSELDDFILSIDVKNEEYKNIKELIKTENKKGGPLRDDCLPPYTGFTPYGAKRLVELLNDIRIYVMGIREVVIPDYLKPELALYRAYLARRAAVEMFQLAFSMNPDSDPD